MEVPEVESVPMGENFPKWLMEKGGAKINASQKHIKA